MLSDPPGALPADLVAALARLQHADPEGWIDQVANAVVALGGPDAGERLIIAADQAAVAPPEGITPTADADPTEDATTAALRELEASLDAPPLPHMDQQQIDLLAALPPVDPLDPQRRSTHRDMSN
jgi:hypothetical protein